MANVLVDTRPREAKFTPDGKEVWVSSEVGGTISVVDASTWKVIKKIRFEVPGVRPELLQPVGMEFTKDGKYLFAALGPANRVAVIDPKTYEVKEYILVGQRPWASRAFAGPEQALRGERADQRHDRHRRGEPQGREVGAGRAPALGRRGDSVTPASTARACQARHGLGTRSVQKRLPLLFRAAQAGSAAGRLCYLSSLVVASFAAFTAPAAQPFLNSSAEILPSASLSTMV